jgi:hypothetical protein
MLRGNARALNTGASYIAGGLTDSFQPISSGWSEYLVEEVQIGNAKVKLEIASAKFPEWLKEAVARLNDVAALPENWDSYGAPAVNQRTLEHALQVLTKVMEPGLPLPRILATGRGGVEFAWHKPNKELEITVDAPLRGQFYFVDEATGEEREEPLGVDYGGLARYVESVVR